MAILKTTEPLYQHSKNGVKKVGYRIYQTITNKAGEIIRHQLLKTHMYKWL